MKTDLRRLILALTIASAVVSLANTFYAGYRVQRQQLIENALDNNNAYATKLAESTEDYLQSALQQLKVSADLLAAGFPDAGLLDKETERLRLQTDSFNSVVIFDRQAMVLSTSPEMLQFKGIRLETPGALESVRTRQPLVSQPYLSAAGNLLIFISQPIRSGNGDYLGTVGGSIYLKRASILHRILGSHYHKDGSYLYVVDRSRRLIYHPESERIGTVVGHNLVIDAVTAGHAGKSEVTNSQGQQMLAGYAIVPATGWGIVAQRPKQATLAPLYALMSEVLLKSLPVALISLLLIWWCARQIAKPLRQLANGAELMDRPNTGKEIQSIRSWYFESHELKRAMVIGINLLHKSISKLREDVQTDPLTGLGNRRSLDMALEEYEKNGHGFSVVAVDIDHFKKINDSHGHDVGDQVLARLAQCIRDVCRANDVPCRIGGEEFLLLLPKTRLKDAAQVAERLRQQIENTEMPAVGRITLSQGVAGWPESAADIPAVLKAADDMLYRAKRNGRNRVETCTADGVLADIGA